MDKLVSNDLEKITKLIENYKDIDQKAFAKEALIVALQVNNINLVASSVSLMPDSDAKNKYLNCLKIFFSILDNFQIANNNLIKRIEVDTKTILTVYFREQ